MTSLSLAKFLSCDGNSGSARNSNMPRETWTAPATLPLAATSVPSRTSTMSVLPLAIISFACAGVIFGTAAWAASSICLTPVAMVFSVLVRPALKLRLPGFRRRYDMARRRRARSIARQNHILQNRINLVLPALAGEHAVMADAGLHVVALEIRAQLAAQVVRRHRLADGANVVALALDGEQHGAPDRGRVDLVAVPLQLAERQRVFLEDDPHRLQIELGGEVEYGEIFVIERFRYRRFLQLAVGDVLVELAVRFDVALDVHAHECRELHEARIDAAERARIAQRHRSGERTLEPLDGMLLGEFVHGGRVDAHVDRPRHQRHAARLRLVAGLRHHGCGGAHRHTGLAHCDHVSARPHHFEELDQMIDIFVEAE